VRHLPRHIANFLGFLLFPLVIPVFLVILILQKLRILKSTADLSADDVARYLEDQINDTAGDWDWDDFTSIPITDPFLDGIRAVASLVDFPIDEAGRDELRELLRQVRSTKA
jgi:hypothetical protein